MSVSSEKSKFFKSDFQLLGFIVTREGISMSRKSEGYSRVQDISKFEIPEIISWFVRTL